MPITWLVVAGSGLLLTAGGMLLGERCGPVAMNVFGRAGAAGEGPIVTAKPPRRKHSEAARLERALAVERRQSRRAHRQERRAQRLLVMARCLMGATGTYELAARAVKAVLDDFGAETATCFAIANGRPERLAEAARRHMTPPVVHFMDAGELIPRVETPERGGEQVRPGIVHCLPLRDERRRTIGFLVVGHTAGRRPVGLETYAAFVGQLLSIELGRSAGADEIEAVLSAVA
jgi:hypothetical protein